MSDYNFVEESICTMFNLTSQKFDTLNSKSSAFIKGYWNGEMSEPTKGCFSYLAGLDNTLDQYLSFGADKAGINNFNNFCEKLNIDPAQRVVCSKGRYHYYSRDRKLTMTVSTEHGNYFHYFGVTGGKNEVLNAFHEFTVNGYNDGLCYGGRDYI